MGLPYEPRLPSLIRVEGQTLVCGSCRRRWNAPAELSADNRDYLWEHASHHESRKHHLPDHRQKLSRWSDPRLEPVQCQTCFQWFNGRRCQKCFPDFRLRRENAPPSTGA
jgi:hypothetical protein